MSVLSDYTKAMVAGYLTQCIAIEKRHDLYGYPPELVSVGLKAVDEGRNPGEAVDLYLEGGAA